MDTGTLITIVLSSAVFSAVITSAKDLMIWKINRKDKKTSESEEESQRKIQEVADRKAQKEKLDYLVERFDAYIQEHQSISDAIIRSNKLIMQDRIRYTGLKCIRAGEISYEDRKLLHEMWDEYHTSWKGNGDLNLIMEAVDELPLK